MANTKDKGSGGDGATAANAPTAPELSAMRPTVNRLLHAYSPVWDGARPAICVGEGEHSSNFASVNIEFNRITDRALRDRLASSAGNSFCDLPVYDPLSSEERKLALAETPAAGPDDPFPVILEWPPKAT